MKPFKRTGLHRLNCPMCPGYAYGTVANLESVGLPACACGETLQPERIELAIMLGLEDAPVVLAWQSMTADKVQSQTRSVGGWQKALQRQGAGTLNRMDVSALEEIRAEQAAAARKRRIAAIMPTPEPLPF